MKNYVCEAHCNGYDVIRLPILTEKSSSLLDLANVYVFKVSIGANKCEIKRLVEMIFNVKVQSVNTLVTKGKVKVFKGLKGRRSNYKKALVRLEDGHKIDLGVGV